MAARSSLGQRDRVVASRTAADHRTQPDRHLGLRDRRADSSTSTNTPPDLQDEAFGTHNATVDTGFGVNGNAYQYSWHVSIFDNIGGSTRDWGGGLFFRATWDGTSDFLSGTTGYACAQVNSATSWAALTDGRVCYSLGPRDWTNIY